MDGVYWTRRGGQDGERGCVWLPIPGYRASRVFGGGIVKGG
jgi:hypothetical protein